MDSWIDDESLFISRSVGSSEGVVQVYRCWSLETPMGDDSFILIGETAIPSEIDPTTVWEQKNYLRLIQFLEVNSAMVNVRGHVILKSVVKSRLVGRPDGPPAYWRCLDVLPMHAFGLVKPVDTHGTPQFLIIGGDVSSTTPATGIDAGYWKAKYDKLDAEIKQLKNELDSLKIGGGVNDALTNCQSENKKLVSEIEDWKSGNKQIQTTLKDVEAERDYLKVSLAVSDKELSACRMENKKLVSEVKDCRGFIESLEVERDSANASLVALNDTLTACESENKKLVSVIDDLKSVNKQTQATLKDVAAERDSLKVSLAASDKELSACQMENKKLVSEVKDCRGLIESQEVERDSLEASLVVVKDALTACESENKKLVNEIEDQKSGNERRQRDLDVERQKAVEEAEKLKIEVSKLGMQIGDSVSKSFLNDSLEKEKDRWAIIAAVECLKAWTIPNINHLNARYKTLNEIRDSSFDRLDLSNHHMVSDQLFGFGHWKAYRNGYKVTITCDNPDTSKEVLRHSLQIFWENKNYTGRMYAILEPHPTWYTVLENL